MLDLILDSKINPVLLSSFVGALSLFGKDNLGKIEEISIKGLNVDMVIVYKYNLFLIAILTHDAKQYIRSEAEKALDMFYSSYAKELNNISCLNVSIFDDFKNLLSLQIQDYSQLINDQHKAHTIGDFGFFTEAIKKWKKPSK